MTTAFPERPNSRVHGSSGACRSAAPEFAALAAARGTLLGLRPTLTLVTAALVIPFLVLGNSPVRALGTAAPFSLPPTEELANP